MSALVALNLEQPPKRRVRKAAASPRPKGPTGERIFQRNITDIQRAVWLDTISQDRIVAAKRTASINGNMNAMADVIMLMRSIDPTIRAARSQRVNGVASIPWDIVPADESNEAGKIAQEYRAMIQRPEADFRKFIEAGVDKRLEGGGIVENIWNEPEEPGPRYIKGFVTVPMQRLRYDRATGAKALAKTTFAYVGDLISSFEPGKFSVFDTDEDILDFGERGVYRTCLSDFFGRMQVFSWWIQGIERFGLPIVHGTSPSKTERDELKLGLRDLGSTGAVVTGDKTTVEMKFANQGTGGSTGIHSEFLLKSDQRIFLAFLGESQSGMIEANAGSKSSAQIHREVADDVVAGDWAAIEATHQRDLAAPWVAINKGPQYLPLTPLLRADLRAAEDMKTFGDGVKVALECGVDLSPGWFYEKTKARPAGPGEQRLELQQPVSPFGGLTGLPSQRPAAAASRELHQASLFQDVEKHLEGLDETAREYMKKGSKAMQPLFGLIEEAAAHDDLAVVEKQLRGLGDTLAAVRMEAAMQGVEAERDRLNKLGRRGKK